jgi:hypothetical protein
MLQGVEAEVGEFRDVFAGCEYPEDAAFFAGLFVGGTGGIAGIAAGQVTAHDALLYL